MRLSSRQHLVQHTAEGKDVGAVIARIAVELFGSHVLHGAKTARSRRQRRLRRHERRRHRHRDGGVERLRACGGRARGQPEIEQFHVGPARRAGAATHEHHVARLQVTMDDARAVGAVERVANLIRDGECLVNRQAPGTAKEVGERLPFEVLEHEIVEPALVADVVDRTDVRIVQRGNCACFVLEAPPRFRVRDERGREHLDGDRAIESRVASAVHLPHAARPELRDDLVRAEARAGFERHTMTAIVHP